MSIKKTKQEQLAPQKSASAYSESPLEERMDTFII